MSRRKRRPEPTGEALAAVRKEFDHPIYCTGCGQVDDLDAYDVMGLDDGDLYCNACGAIGPMKDLADYSDVGPVVVVKPAGPAARSAAPRCLPPAPR